MRSMKQIDFYVPLNLNGGEQVPQQDLQHIEDSVVADFGGCTLHLPLLGIWMSPEGLRHQDQILIIEIVTQDCPSLLERILAIRDIILKRVVQQEVFVTIRPVKVI